MERLFTITKSPVIPHTDISALNISKREIKGVTLKEAVNEFERQYIGRVLESVGGNRKRAAEKLGIHRNTLLGKLNKS